MDEKGFLIGKLQKTRRVFTRERYEQGTLTGVGQDGSREWIAVAATTCADGTKLSPALIYKAISGYLQDTWLNNFDLEEHNCHFASSPKGWTSDELGYNWLIGLFEKETAPKGRRSHRLLFVDGHGSHFNMKFFDWCEQHKFLLSVNPPHSTHRLQHLDGPERGLCHSILRKCSRYSLRQTKTHQDVSQPRGRPAAARAVRSTLLRRRRGSEPFSTAVCPGVTGRRRGRSKSSAIPYSAYLQSSHCRDCVTSSLAQLSGKSRRRRSDRKRVSKS
jgi:hypothetical protein